MPAIKVIYTNENLKPYDLDQTLPVDVRANLANWNSLYKITYHQDGKFTINEKINDSAPLKDDEEYLFYYE